MVVCLTVDLETKEGIKPTKKLAEAVNYNLTVYITGVLLEKFGSSLNFLKKCCVGLHGYHHVHLAKLPYTKQFYEIRTAQTVYNKFFNTDAEGWRSPYLSFNRDTLKILSVTGFKWDSSFERSRWTWIRRLQSPIGLIPIDKPLNKLHEGTVLLHGYLITEEQITQAKRLKNLKTHKEVYEGET